MQVLHYVDPGGNDLYQDWLDGLRDTSGRVAIQRRVDRIAETGNLGSHGFCRDGVWELKIDVGPGYRVYYVEVKKTAPPLWRNQADPGPRYHAGRKALVGLSGTIMKSTRTRMTSRAHRSHQEATVQSLRRDPKFAAAYLNAVMEDGDRAELMTALRYVTEAFGGVPAVARKTGLNATTLYRTLSPKGNPELKNFMDIMRAVGMRIIVEPAPARR